MDIHPPVASGLRRALLAPSIAGLLAAAPLCAQQVAPPTSATTPARSERVPTTAAAEEAGAAKSDTVTLNPFEVNTQKDDGFLATNAGTATKLGIDMKDLAAPYSVMTGEFIKALGITNLQDAAHWSTNGAPVLDGQGADIFQGANTRTTTTMYFSRGVIMNAGQQRNYFVNAGLNDAYNVERIDFGRGPNAVLFNVGANDVLGGGISMVGKRARTDRDFTTVSFTTGSWDYYRSTLDVNEALNDKLALRGNFLWQQRNGWQYGEEDDRTGVTLAGTWRITEKTELNVEVRRDKVERSRPPVPFGDNLSGWDGSTVFNGPISNYQYDGLTALTGTSQTLQRLPDDSSGQGRFEGIWRMGDNYIYDPASGTVMNWLHSGSTRRGDEDPWVPIYFNGEAWSRGGNNQLLPIGNYGATGGNTRWRTNVFDNGGQAAFYDMTNLPDDRFSRQIAGSNLRVPGPRDSLLPDHPITTEVTKGVYLGLAHKFSDDLHFEMQGDANEVAQDTLAPSTVLGLRNLFVDLNQYLPNGEENPHFLDAYGESDMGMRSRIIKNAGVRAALAFTKDFGKWGHYTFNLSGMATARDVQYRERYYTLNFADDPRDWNNGAYRMRARYYLNDSNRPFFDAAPTTLLERTATNATGSDTTYTSTSTAIQPSRTLSYWEDRQERNQSATFAFAGRWFDNKLIISPGVRIGRQKTRVRLPNNMWGQIWGLLPDDPNWDGNTLDERYWRPDAPADWKSLTFTPRAADGTPLTTTPIPSGWRARPRTGSPIAGTRNVYLPDSRYTNANDRFRDDYNRPVADNMDVNTTVGATYHLFDWAALKLSYGTSFLPADVGRFTLDDSDAESETGIAYEAAVTFNLFNDRLAVTPRYYFNRKENILRGSPIEKPVNTLMDTRAWNDIYPDAGNPYGYARIYGGDYVANYNDGYELEVAGKITRGWRLSASIGTARINEYDRWPLSPAYVRARQEEFREVLEAAGGIIDTSQKPTNNGRTINDAPGVAIANPAISDPMIQAVSLVDGTNGNPQLRTNAVNAYNNIWVEYDNMQNQTEGIGLDRLSAKLVTDYSVQTGKLKGFRYGIAVYYVDRDLAGYRGGDTIPNPNFDATQAVSATNRPWIDDPSVDGNTPVWVKRPFQIDALFGYTRKIRGFGRLDGTEVEFQLNIKNVLNDSDVYYQDDGVTLRPPDGDITAPNRVAVPGRIASYQRPINFEFTTTFKF